MHRGVAEEHGPEAGVHRPCLREGKERDKGERERVGARVRGLAFSAGPGLLKNNPNNVRNQAPHPTQTHTFSDHASMVLGDGTAEPLIASSRGLVTLMLASLASSGVGGGWEEPERADSKRFAIA